MTTTTMGHLVATLFARYERSYNDPALAALATRVELERLTGAPAPNVGLAEATAAASTAMADAWERAS